MKLLLISQPVYAGRYFAPRDDLESKSGMTFLEPVADSDSSTRTPSFRSQIIYVISIFGALCFLLGVALSPVLAQSAIDTGSDRMSAYRWNDGGSVDIQSGSFTYSVDDVSIGSGAAPSRLTLTRRMYRIGGSLNPQFANMEISSFGKGMEHNFESSVECNWQIYTTCERMTVHVNGERYQFDANPQKNNLSQIVPWAEYLAIGDTLTETATSWTFRSKDGFEADFPKSPQYSCSLYCALASQWVWPNGDKIVFSYEQAYTLQRNYEDYNQTPMEANIPVNRLTKVSNLHGDAILFSYVNPPGGSVPNEEALSAADFLRLTVKSVTTDKSQCAATSATACTTGPSESVSYNYGTDNCNGPSNAYSIFPTLTTVTHANGAQSTLSWLNGSSSPCINHLLVSETDPTSTSGGLLFSNQYDGAGGVLTHKDGVGRQWSYARTVTGQGTPAGPFISGSTTTDPLGNKTSYTFNGAEPGPLTVVDANNNTTAIGRDYQFISQITTPLGIIYTYSRDDRGNITSYVVKPISGAHADQTQIQTSAIYPDCTASNWRICNKPSTVTDDRGGITQFVYDPNHGGMTSMISPAPSSGAVLPQVRIAYSLMQGVYLPSAISTCQNTASCSGTADESKTTFAYDQNLSLASMTTGSGNAALQATAYAHYDGLGDITSVVDPLGNATNFTYDAVRQLTTSTTADPDGAGPLNPRTTLYHYTLLGQVDTISRGYTGSGGFVPLQVTKQSFDASGRPLTTTLLDGSGGTTFGLVQNSYDADGRPDCTALRMNPTAFASPLRHVRSEHRGAMGPTGSAAKPTMQRGRC